MQHPTYYQAQHVAYQYQGDTPVRYLGHQLVPEKKKLTGHTKLLRVVIHSEYRPTLVGSDNDVRALHPRKRIFNFLSHECLPVALNRRYIEIRPIDDLVNERRLSQSAHDDRCGARER